MIISEPHISPLAVGIVGCGRVATTRHLPALQGLAEARVAALAEVDERRLHDVADRFGIEKRYLDYRFLLDDETIGAVAVCVPAHLHREVAAAAMEVGKSILVEKPLALTLDDCDHLIERAAQSDVKALVGHNMRWHRLIRQGQEIVERGRLGRVALMRTVFAHPPHAEIPDWRKSRESGGGEILEVAIHHFDLWRFFLQTEVEDVWACSSGGRGDDEVVTVLARTADGVQLSTVVCGDTGAKNEVELFGAEGTLRISCYDFDGLEYRPSSLGPGGLQNRLRRLSDLPGALVAALPANRAGGDWAASFRAEWKHFLEVIRAGAPIESTLEDGRRAVQISLAAIESAISGRPVEIRNSGREVVPPRSD